MLAPPDICCVHTGPHTALCSGTGGHTSHGTCDHRSEDGHKPAHSLGEAGYRHSRHSFQCTGAHSRE